MNEQNDLNENDGNGNGQEKIISLKGMYEDYFLDYASYVILERAVPYVEDGLKPVQRRILHAMKEKDDGRFHKVANIIGNTMQYHPHGDAAIGDALVNLGQKDLLIDCQGNWGDTRTGDRAAAARYIEARLTKFALAVAFNPQTTEWQLSYDGRKKEPVTLPMKFPLLLSQGVEGIAVGLSTKILPHNFIELIKASIKILQDKRVKIYPDFQTGGMIDVEDYNSGKRGGRVKVRARMEIVEKHLIAIRDLPYGITTGGLIDSIIKANEKGKIKIKKVTDNTAQDVEILIELAPGISPDVTIDALYAFTLCEASIAPNACIVIDNKPHFVSVEDILRVSTFNTKELLRRELEIEKNELEEKLHFASLEKIFIEKRVYREIEECETWEAVIDTIDQELKKYVVTPSDPPQANDPRIRLLRDVTQDDIVRLTEIRIKRISKFNSFKADELIAKLEEALEKVKHHLATLTEYTIAFFENLLEQFGKGRERRTEITSFDAIKPTQVVVNNSKLYANFEEGFIGHGMKKDEFICDCSDIDDIIVFRKDGKFQVSRIADKVFVGKDIIHVDVWKKGDERTTYNMVYLDGKTGRAMAKRFNVNAITRDREYDLTKGTKNSKTLYFSANPNGEAEVITVQLTQASTARKKAFDFDFGTMDIKGRGSAGNILTRYPVRKISLKEAGKSTLGALKVWMDEVSGRINTEERGLYLGEFDTGEQLLALYKDGSYEVTDLEVNKKFDTNDLQEISKFDPDLPVNVIYHEGGKGWTMVKRFVIETSKHNQRYNFLSEEKGTKLYFASTNPEAKVSYAYKSKNQKHEAELDFVSFMEVKGWKALGNKLTEFKLITVKDISPEFKPEFKRKDKKPVPSVEEEFPEQTIAEQETPEPAPKPKSPPDQKLHPGDTIDFDVEEDGQGKLF
ncbi:MAG: DNA gyrase/topoisomerase IV subunit A [Saprospiraceae bacterium]|nr:DNA gyrase/topoisomerase IV subunit A [Saprospiraceae bacterium]MCB9324202.1 DNA gyrase/topoisomerase IV subunit A [Lewinellaceae bacterium]